MKSRKKNIESVEVDYDIQSKSILTGHHVAVKYVDGSVKNRIMTSEHITMKYGRYLDKNRMFSGDHRNAQDQSIESVEVDYDIQSKSILTGHHVTVKYVDGSVKNRIMTSEHIKMKYGQYLDSNRMLAGDHKDTKDQVNEESEQLKSRF